MKDSLIDATEAVLDRFESDDDVAYAEVGGVERRIGDGVVTADRTRTATDLTETGIWWRVFADGAADYRYATSLDDDHLEDLIDRSIRSAKMLDQSVNARYDWGTMHRATHPGWATSKRSAAELPTEETAERVRLALADAVDDLNTDRTRSSYRAEGIEYTVLTTTGTAVTTTLDRVAAETVVVPSDGPKVSQHAGTTTGEDFLDVLPERFEELAERARRVAAAEPTTLEAANQADVVFGPLASGSLVHQLSHYLEIDSVYFGSSPFEVGDRVGPTELSIADTVHPGSWSARAYDAEGRPTQSVALVSNGVVTNRLYDTASAAEEDDYPTGHLIPSLGFEDPPRVHARHLDVSAGSATDNELRDGADLYVERVGEPRLHNEATRTKRASTMPPSVLYAKDIAESTPSEFESEHHDQEIHFPITEAYMLDEGERESLVAEGSIAFSLADLQNVTGIGTTRRTLTGTCEKHKSTLPFAVTAPAIRLATRIKT